MHDSLLYTIIADYRVHAATIFGLVGAVLSSRKAADHLTALRPLLVEAISLSLPFLVFLLYRFSGVMRFDWSGEFSDGILAAFGFAYSIQLLRFGGWKYRGAGLLCAISYAILIYTQITAWINRGVHGYPGFV